MEALCNKRAYAANRVGGVATTYSPKHGPHHAGMACLKFFLTNTGDVLRRLYLQQDDAFVEKASVLVSLTCGPATLVHKLPWLLWARVPGTVADQHAMSNELLLLDGQHRRLRLPMASVAQECLTLTLHMPDDMARRGKWRVIGAWDFMSREWRSQCAATALYYSMAFPVAAPFAINRGRMATVAKPAVRLGPRRHSNPLT